MDIVKKVLSFKIKCSDQNNILINIKSAEKVNIWGYMTCPCRQKEYQNFINNRYIFRYLFKIRSLMFGLQTTEILLILT